MVKGGRLGKTFIKDRKKGVEREGKNPNKREGLHLDGTKNHFLKIKRRK